MLFENVLRNLVIGYKVSFIIGLCSLLIAKYFLPEFLQYGKTLIKRPSNKNDACSLQKVVQFTVPKSFFSHFYYLSTILTMVTLYYYHNCPFVWLILFHSLRRLYETKYICKYTANSRMSWSHYVVGIWFYSVLNLILNLKLYEDAIPYSLKPVPLVIFCLASWDQYESHQILSHLVKYTLPNQKLFQFVCCPHYLDEIVIYGSLVAYNSEFLWPLAWVLCTLSMSALETRKYYLANFKHANVPKYAIIPFVL